jgi:hypothetical protein
MRLTVLLSVIFFSLTTKAQFVNQLVFSRAYTPHEVDSTLAAQGIPSGIFTASFGAKAYKVIYNTVSWDSTPTIASGLMIIPDNPPCKVGIMSYQHGTTAKKTDVPSRYTGEWFLALAAASRGIITVMPDYLGLGDGPGLHPYQHAHTEATATIDLIRAAKQVSDSLGAPYNDQLFLMGYSQGGHATMAAHQLIQKQLDNEMHVTAAAPMSGAYDLSGVMTELMLSDSTYPAPFYLPYLLFAYNEVYNFYADVSDVIRSPYDTVLPPLFDGTYANWQIDNVMPGVPKLIMTQTQIDSFTNDTAHFFRVRLKENDTYNWLPTSPIRMYYCMGDKQVPYQNSIVAYQKFIAQGATNVDTVNVSATLDHVPCAQIAILGAVNWFISLLYEPLGTSTSATDASSANATDGTATANGIEGNSGYLYNWSTGDTAQTITGLAPGKYYVTITDQNDCERTDSVQVGVINGVPDFVLNNLQVFPNPASNHLNVTWSDINIVIQQVELLDQNGQQATITTQQSATNLEIDIDSSTPKGVYTLKLQSSDGKGANRKVVIL